MTVTTDLCLMCAACETACPMGAITTEDGQYVIDKELCVECGACEGVCPTGAIAAD